MVFFVINLHKKGAMPMEPVEFREMDMILAVSEELSFTRAAEKIFISQPALSKIVRRVERNLGTAVFDRGSSPLRVTPEGERILEYFRRMRAVRDEMERYCGELRRHSGASLTVGAPSFFCTYVLPPAVSAWQMERPDCAVRLVEANDAELRSLLAAGAIDAGLTVESEVPPGIEPVVLQREHVILAVPRECAVNRRLKQFALTPEALRMETLGAGAAPAVPVSEFAAEKFLFLKEGNDIRARGLKICRDAGFEPQIVMELDQLLTAYRLAEAGLGITFVRAAIPCCAGFSSDLCLYRIDHPDTVRDVRALYSPAGKAAPLRAAFVEFLRSFMPRGL